MKKWISIVFIMLLLLSTVAGCGDNNTAEANNGIFSNTSTSDGTTNTAEAEQVDFSQTDADMFTDRDYETDYDESSSILIHLNGSSVTSTSDSVQISGTTVTITEEATYLISGTLDLSLIHI